METPEGADLLSEWAVDASDAADSELQLLVAIPDDDAALQGAPEAPRRSRKKHRATYLRTKDAKQGLQDEIAALESRLAVLRRRAGLEGDKSSVQQTAVHNAVLRGVVHQQHMAMAGAHSVLVKQLNKQATHPLYSYIRLTKDWQARRQTVTAMRDLKLRNTTQYLLERSSGLDELTPHSSQDVTQDEDGNIVCSQFDITQLPDARSIHEVFDAIRYFFSNEEIVLSERMGFLAIRDDFDMVDGNSVNQRMYWIDANGVTTEWNCVGFSNIFDGSYAVLTSDSVDVDERYPFQPATRVRRAWSGGILLSVVKKNDGSNSSVVVMRRASITKLHLPEFPLTGEMKDLLVKSVFGWSEAMKASIRFQLSLPTSAAPTLSIAADIENI